MSEVRDRDSAAEEQECITTRRPVQFTKQVDGNGEAKCLLPPYKSKGIENLP